MSDCCMVLFRGPHDLTAAAAALTAEGLRVERDDDALTVTYDDSSPSFRVVLSRAAHVAEEAAEIGEGTPHAATLATCDARFEIAIDDLDEALDEINTLIQVQAALQGLTGGIMYTAWNGNLQAPEPA